MGQRRQKKTDKTPAGREEAYYVYCIGESQELEPIFRKDKPPPIEPDLWPEYVMIQDAGLSAITSPVLLTDYGEEALRERMADATWVAVRAMRHEKVVEHFSHQASVLPLRFGTIYLECENVELMLDEKRDELLAIIERLRGREEWGVNVYCDRTKLTENITSLSPRLREMSAQAEAASPGQSYLMRKKIDAMRDGEARAEIKRVAGEIERELLTRSESAARLRVLKDEASAHGELAAKLAFLVERASFNDFREAAERLAGEYSAAGFQLELTGPWPAYNFAAGRE